MRDSGRGKLTGFLQTFHRAISCSRRDQTNDRGAAGERELGGFHGPINTLLLVKEGRINQDKGANGDAFSSQEPGRRLEMAEIEPFIEQRQNARMDGLQSEGDLERGT